LSEEIPRRAVSARIKIALFIFTRASAAIYNIFISSLLF
jgi:hypothetical protein